MERGRQAFRSPVLVTAGLDNGAALLYFGSVIIYH